MQKFWESVISHITFHDPSKKASSELKLHLPLGEIVTSWVVERLAAIGDF